MADDGLSELKHLTSKTFDLNELHSERITLKWRVL